jgi:hypothetical protein
MRQVLTGAGLGQTHEMLDLEIVFQLAFVFSGQATGLFPVTQ